MANRKDKAMTLQQHSDTADDIARAEYYLNRVFRRCGEHYPLTHKLMKVLFKLIEVILVKVKSLLDAEYHRAVTDDEFFRHGHIYFNLNKRFKG